MTLLLVLFACTILPFGLSVQAHSFEVEPELGFSTGPSIGEKVPEFELPDQHGEMKNINDLIGENGAILNFYRSASW